MDKSATYPMAMAALAFGTGAGAAKAASIDGIYARVRLSAMCAPVRSVWYSGNAKEPPRGAPDLGARGTVPEIDLSSLPRRA